MHSPLAHGEVSAGEPASRLQLIDTYKPPPTSGHIVTPDDVARESGYLVHGLIPRTVTLSVGISGSGKSTLAESLVRAVLDPHCYDYQWLGHPIVAQPAIETVLWLSTDMGEGSTRFRNFAGEPRIKFHQLYPASEFSSYWPDLAAEIRRCRFDLVVVDHTGHMTFGSQNDDATVSATMAFLTTLNCPIFLVHHASKSTKPTADPVPMGATQWIAQARVVLGVSRAVAGGDVLRLTVPKLNSGPKPDPIYFRIDWATAQTTVIEYSPPDRAIPPAPGSSASDQIKALAKLAGQIDINGDTPLAAIVRQLLDEKRADVATIRRGRRCTPDAIAQMIRRDANSRAIWDANLPKAPALR